MIGAGDECEGEGSAEPKARQSPRLRRVIGCGGDGRPETVVLRGTLTAGARGEHQYSSG
jgi:hypothetical protein